MICEQCKAEGKKSKVYVGSTASTCMGGGGAYYDEDGQYHYYDPNYHTTRYSCSNGHAWVEERGPSGIKTRPDTVTITYGPSVTSGGKP
jgi:hypothetical protein